MLKTIFTRIFSKPNGNFLSKSPVPDHGACPTGLETAQELRQREGCRRQQDKIGQPHRRGEGHDIRRCKRDPSALNSQNDSLTYNNIT